MEPSSDCRHVMVMCSPGASTGWPTVAPYQFSLILATVGRSEEVERFLCSLDEQHGVAFELIVVDQNTDDRLVPHLLRRRGTFPIRHLRSAPGVSRARNVGLEYASGSIVAFPDDDCWYPEGLLSRVDSLLRQNPDLGGVTGRQTDAEGRPWCKRLTSNPTRVDVLNVWSKAISITIFLRQAVVAAVGPFDEHLGVGAGSKFASGEETDYLVRAIRFGFRFQYLPQIHVHHPNPLAAWDVRMVKRARGYGAGMGRVLRKHHYPAWFKAKILVRPLAGALLSLAALRLGKSRYHLSTFLGRLEGLISSNRG